MEQTQIKKKRRRWIIAVGISVFLIMFVSGNYGLYRLIQIDMEQSELQDEIELLQEEQLELEEVRKKLTSDLDYIEKIAREKYGMIRKGERVFIVMPDKKN